MHPKTIVSRTVILCVGFAAAATAQNRPPGQPLPNMQAIAQALGVNCDYCHVAERGSSTPEPKKDIARAMLAMTRDINAKIQAAAGPTALSHNRLVR